jgi:hypothetical protein
MADPRPSCHRRTDYVGVRPTMLTFGSSETTKTAAVTINGDTTVEPNENYYVRLTSPVGATIADATAVGVITNDDVAVVSNVSTGAPP